MQLGLLYQLFSHEVVTALCWTLIHSLWEGLIASLFAGIIILGTRKASASFRYTLLTLIFLLFLAGSVITFTIQWHQQSNSGHLTTSQIPIFNAPNYKTAIAPITTYTVPSETFTDQFVNYFNRNAPLVVLIWTIFFVGNCIRLLSGFYYIHRIRTYKIHKPSEEWKNKLLQLSKDLGIHQSIILLQSEIVKVPVAIGILKPVILLPLGLLSNLPADQVETILLHELAHIKRKDYLVNLLQTIATTIFFFNPAILWISSLIREEREACCDDIVVNSTSNKKSYLEALVSFQEYTLSQSKYALSLAGRKPLLLHRVKRILTHENKKLNIMEKVFLLSGLIIISAFGFIPTKKPVIHYGNVTGYQSKPKEQRNDVTSNLTYNHILTEKQIASIQPIKKQTDTLPKQNINKPNSANEINGFTSIISRSTNDDNSNTYELIATDTKGKKYTLKKLDGQITELTINGSTIPKKDYDKYSDVIEQLEGARMKREQKEIMAQKMKETQLEYENKELQLKKELEIMKEAQDRQQVEMQKTIEVLEQQRKQVEMENQKQIEQSMNKIQDSQKQYEAVYDARNINNSNGDIPSIISDLYQNKVITSEDPLSFTLNNKELVVNGKKQPAELHQKLKSRYIRKPGDFFNYVHQGGTTSSTIKKD
jgi:beta-lactamase regulating signal transducer with metallopeptidase domain